MSPEAQRTNGLTDADPPRYVMFVFGAVGGTLDRVNTQLDRVDVMTSSAANAVTAVDGVVRALTGTLSMPIQKLSGLVSGAQHGASAFRARRDWRVTPTSASGGPTASVTLAPPRSSSH